MYILNLLNLSLFAQRDKATIVQVITQVGINRQNSHKHRIRFIPVTQYAILISDYT